MQKVNHNKAIKNKGWLIALCFFSFTISAQVNYIGNPSFEEDCTPDVPLYWPGLDSLNCASYAIASECLGSVPKNPFTFQYARSGKSYMLSTFYNSGNGFQSVLKNRLVAPLKKDVTYCVRFYVNISNNSTVGIDAFDGYFCNKTIDTVSVCPQKFYPVNSHISNSNNNIVTDTLNWTAIQGTYTAIGGECYLVLGSLRSSNSTNTVLISSLNLPSIFADVCLDDVSCVPINLPANAGQDKPFFAGDSVFVGRTPNVGIDYACTWYQLPNMATPIATVAGLWVKPVQTTTYVVAQQLWCNGIKCDTVVVYKDAVGIKDLEVYLQNINLFPNPANNQLNIQFTQTSISSSIKNFRVYNQLAENVDLPFAAMAEGQFQVDCNSLSPGVYYLRFEVESGGSFVKKFVVGR